MFEFSLPIPKWIKDKTREAFQQLPRSGQFGIIYAVYLVLVAYVGYGLFDHIPVLGHPLFVILYIPLAVLGYGGTERLIGPATLPAWNPKLFLDRHSLSSDTAKAFLKSQERLVILTGESGTGKSTLATEYLAPTLRTKGWLAEVVAVTENEANFKEQLKVALGALGVPVEAAFYSNPRLSSAGAQRDRLLIVDQFEQLLANSPLSSLQGSVPLHGGLAWFDMFLASWLTAANNYCLLILRHEFFVHLRFLHERQIPIFKNTLVLPGVAFASANAPDTVEAVNQLKEVAGDTRTVDLITQELRERSSVLALEIAMIVHVLGETSRRRDRRSISPREYRSLFGSSTGILRRFFGRVIEASGDRRTVSATLFALACRRRTAAFSATELQFITHAEPTAIDRALRLLVDAGIVIETRYGKYTLKHDYLAESFDDVSAGFLDAEDRDTIQFFAEASPEARSRLTVASRVAYCDGSEATYYVIDAVFLLVAAAIVLRLWGLWGGQLERYLGLTNQGDNPQGRIDWRYLPAFLGSAACTAYCWQLYRNLLFRMRDRQMLTGIALVVTLLMIGAGTLLPHLWLFFACVAAYLIGVRLMAASWGSVGGAAFHKRNKLQWTARRYIVYQTLALLVSVGLAVVRYPVLAGYAGGAALQSVISNVDRAFGSAIEGIVAFVMLIYMWVSWRLHATEAQSSVMLGFWDRMKTIETGPR